MSSSGASDVDELPELGIKGSSVHPYQYEPTVLPGRVISESESDPDSDTDSDSKLDASDDDMPLPGLETEVDDISLWCSCSRCSAMPTRRECKCCRNTNVVDSKVEEADLKCITEHEGFQVNCLNQYVLETTYYEYVQDNGPLEDNAMIHETYRYLAYRRFVRWVWHKLRKKNRRILPSCVVTAIRGAFPSQEYCGFKYPK
ncbi:P2X purinoceptor 7-like [Mytilus edulis]